MFNRSAGQGRLAGGAGGEVDTRVIRRNRALMVGLLAVVASSAVTWLVGSRIRSPAEIAARTAAPKASLITVPVERRVLSSDVVVRGTVRYGTPQGVLLPASALKKVNGILTTAPEKGKELSEGSVALTVSGRPVFVLQGAQPAYRDLGPGVTGEDVRQLERALARLGFNPGPADGVYDDRTGLAVAAWYLKGGWTPLGPTEEQIQALRAGQADWYTAQSELLGAQEALAAAEHDLAIAQQKAVLAKGVPPAPTPSTAPAASGDSAAQSRAEQERVNADLRVANARKALERATEEERAAQARLEEARTRRPPPSNDEYAALSKESRDASDRVAAARDELTAAQEAQTAVQDRSGGTTATPLESSAPAAPDPQTKLDAATTQAEAARAADNVAFARRRVGLMTRRPGTGPSATQLGVQVPAGEVLFFASLPLRVDDVKLRVGDEALGPVMTVTNSRLVVESALSPNDAKLVRQGGTVAIRVPDAGVEATGTVSQLATVPGTNGVDPQRFFMEVTPTGIDVSLAGASVVQSISVESTQGEVLAVPVSALSVGADGSTRVQVQRGAATRSVTVNPGLTAKGLVAVSPTRGELSPGDLVVVGHNGAGAKTTSGGSNGR